MPLLSSLNFQIFVLQAGFTHIVRELDRPGSKNNKKVMEAAIIIVTPPMIAVGVFSYLMILSAMYLLMFAIESFKVAFARENFMWARCSPRTR